MEFHQDILRSLLLLPLFAIWGCGSAPNRTAAVAALREAHLDPALSATVSGRVLFAGTPPKPIKLDLSANPTCERQHLRPVYSENVLVKNGGLQNALVYVKSGLPSLHWTSPPGAVLLNQDGCVYEPHVLALMTGQTLEISNADPLNHNVHAEAVLNAPFNFAQPPRAEKLFHKFEHQEIMIPVTCGVHPWMRAYVSVLDHPFFAVTDQQGKFQIEGLPPGSYVLEAAQEVYGRQQLTVSLVAKEQHKLDFTYTADSR
jgi:hypothetical protein